MRFAKLRCIVRRDMLFFLKTVSEKMENRQEEDPGRIVRQCAMEYLRENALSAEEKERIAQLGERLGLS